MVPRFRLPIAIILATALLSTLITSSPAHAAGPEAGAPVTSVTLFAGGTPLPTGSEGIVRADGECLRLRESPGLAGAEIVCLPEGTVVVVLSTAQVVDGFSWQMISSGGRTGWVADDYLAPHDGSIPTSVSASASACQTGTPTAYRPGLTGFVPRVGGVGLVVWGGGTVAGIENASLSRGCTPKAVWTSRLDGELVGYLFGAPSFVNDEWRATFPDGWVSGGRVLLVVCEKPSEIAASSAAIGGTGGIPATAPPPTFSGVGSAPNTSALAVAVIDEASGAVLFEKDGHRPLAPASLTKIATAIVAIEGMEPSSIITTDVDSRKMPGSSVLGLIPGDCFTGGELLYGLMLPSGNDVAVALARYQGGSEAAFVQQMNTLAARLGLTSTHFTDPHGLGSPEHLSSAYDIAMLARYGMSLARFRDVVKERAHTSPGARTLSMYNTNSLLSNYPGADGVKTGFTDEAGRTIAVSASRSGNRVYVVLLNDQNRDVDARSLLDWAFANHTWP